MVSNIRWKKSDYLTLGKAVANFNKQIKKLENEENKLYLPEPVKYADIKNEIYSRRKLNDVIRSLRSFNKISAEPTMNPNSGLVITKWEMQENQLKSARAQQTLAKQGLEISRTLNLAKAGKKRISAKQQQEMRLQYLEIVENLRDLKQFREDSGMSYMTYKQTINKLGNIDYNLIKATIYRQNFEYALDSFKDFEGYELFKNKLERVKNPMYFYKFTRRSEYFKDIFIHYREGEGVITGSDNTEQGRFNEALEQTGIVKETRNKLARKYKGADSGTIKTIQSIETAEDLFSFINNSNDKENILKYLGIDRL